MKGYFREALDRVGLLTCEYGARVTVFGFCGVHIEGHKGLSEYADDCVTVRLEGGKTLRVTGCRLRVKEITRDELFIGGKICGLNTDERRSV